MDVEQLDSLEGMTTDEIRAAYEAGQLDQILGKTDPLLDAVERKLARPERTDQPPPTRATAVRSGSQPPSLPLNGDPLEQSLSRKLGIDPRRFRGK